MQSNKNLHTAKKEKNDEFYTRIEDVEAELQHYTKHFAGKVVYCNFDDPAVSAFWQYFHQHFAELGLKKLIATHINLNYKTEYDGHNDVTTTLQGMGDFRSPECIELLKEADIICTNPAFSLFRQLIKILVDYGKDFLVIGNKNAITYKEVFPLLKGNRIWLGKNDVKEFIQHDGSVKKFGNVGWFTNLSVLIRQKKIVLCKTYSSSEFPRYDNFDAINVNRIADIPCDYTGMMGVPISFLEKYCPDQFEIIGAMTTTKVKGDNYGYPYINGKKKYARIIIRRIDLDSEASQSRVPFSFGKETNHAQ